MLHEYEKVFDEWLAEGIIEEVPQEERDDPGFYLPHRSFIKENSTSRIRPVFDASVKGVVIDIHLDQLLEKTRNDNEKAVIRKLKESFYVDNCVSSVKPDEEAVMFRKKQFRPWLLAVLN